MLRRMRSASLICALWIALAATAHDGDCVLVTGHILGAYSTGHFDFDAEGAAGGPSFSTRIDRLEARDTPEPTAPVRLEGVRHIEDARPR